MGNNHTSDILNSDSKNVTNTTTTTTTSNHDTQHTNITTSAKRPEWMNDADAGSCTLCSLDFFFVVRRRHHCRACGALVCDDCSSFRIKIPRLDYHTNVRVCDLCWVREPAYLYGNLAYPDSFEKKTSEGESKNKKETERQPGEAEEDGKGEGEPTTSTKRTDWRKGSRGDVV